MNKDTKMVRKTESIGGYKAGKIEQCHNAKALNSVLRYLGFLYPIGHRLCDHTSLFAGICYN